MANAIKKYTHHLDLAQLAEIRNAKFQSLASDPSTPVEGQIYYNNVTKRLRQYTGVTWIEFEKGTNLSLANNTATTLDVLSDTGADITIPQATATLAGLLGGADKLKLNNTPADTTTALAAKADDTNVVHKTGNETVAGNKVFTGDVQVNNLTVTGTTTTVNTTELNIADNVLTLNSDFTTGVPTENAGIEIRRGSSPTVSSRWNEATDRWEFTNDGTVFYNHLFTGGVFSAIQTRSATGDLAGSNLLYDTNKLSLSDKTGTNVAGDSLTIAASAGTGNATASTVFIQSPSTGTTGSAVQTMVNRIEVNENRTKVNTPLEVGTGTGTATHSLNRGAIANFASLSYRTASVEQFAIGMRGDGTNNLHFRDSINSVSPILIRQNATPQVGFGNIALPSAYVHIAAGTAAAGTAALKLTPGALLTAIEDGAFEYNGTDVYFSIGTVRKKLNDQTGGGSSITAKDENTTLTTTAASFNFVGSAVAATNTGNDVTVTINAAKKYGVQFNATTDWVGASAPFTYTVAAATHGCGANRFLSVQAQEDGAPNSFVSVDSTVSDTGEVVLISLSKFAGAIIIIG